MLRKLSLGIAFLVFLFSCSSEDSSTGNTNPPNNEDPVGETDTTAPLISITGIDEAIEVLTSIDILISDNSSNVSTKIFIDDVEVFSSQERQFSYEIDPFDFQIGDRVLKVVSEDNSENETTEMVSFTLNKLLFGLSDLQGRPLDGTIDYYLTLNTMAGSLITSQKIESDEELLFYADDGFERQDIIATLFLIFSNPNTFPRSFVISYGDVPAGTRTLNNTELMASRNQRFLTNNFQMEMTDAASDTNFFMNGKDYELISGFSFAEGNFNESGRYNPNNPSSAFIYSSSENTNNIESYKYLFFNDLNENTTISFNDFQSIQQTDEIIVPDEVTDFTFQLRAFEDTNAFNSGEFNTVLRFSGNKEDINGVINIPMFDEFALYQQEYNANLTENIGWVSFLSGLSTPQIPNWSAELQNREVITSGNYDFLQTIATFTSLNPDNTITWFFNSERKESFIMPFETFELPDEISTFLNSIQINITNYGQITFYRADLFEYEQKFDIVEGLFSGFPFLNSKGDQQVLGFTLIN